MLLGSKRGPNHARAWVEARAGAGAPPCGCVHNGRDLSVRADRLGGPNTFPGARDSVILLPASRVPVSSADSTPQTWDVVTSLLHHLPQREPNRDWMIPP
jgi:hypothetical protein